MLSIGCADVLPGRRCRGRNKKAAPKQAFLLERGVFGESAGRQSQAGARWGGLTMRLPGVFNAEIAAISSPVSAKSKILILLGMRLTFSVRDSASTRGCWINQRRTICATLR